MCIQLRTRLRRQVRRQLNSELRRQLRAQLHAALYHALFAKLFESLIEKTFAALFGAISGSKFRPLWASTCLALYRQRSRGRRSPGRWVGSRIVVERSAYTTGCGSPNRLEMGLGRARQGLQEPLNRCFWSKRHRVSHAFHVQGSWGGSLPLSISPHIRAHLPVNLGGNLRPDSSRHLGPTLGRVPSEYLTRYLYLTLLRYPGRNLTGNPGGNLGPYLTGNPGQIPSQTLGRYLGQHLPPNPGGNLGWLEFSTDPHPEPDNGCAPRLDSGPVTTIRRTNG
jgi:hypothetical protein